MALNGSVDELQSFSDKNAYFNLFSMYLFKLKLCAKDS